jgi:hypothetical protein
VNGATIRNRTTLTMAPNCHSATTGSAFVMWLYTQNGKFDGGPSFNTQFPSATRVFERLVQHRRHGRVCWLDERGGYTSVMAGGRR